MFLLVSDFPVWTKFEFLHFTWMSGSLVTFFYITSVKFYLKDHSPHLRFMKVSALISFGGALIAFLIYKFIGPKLFVDNETPFITYNNLFMNQMGGFNPGVTVKILAIFSLIPAVYSLLYFLNLIKKSKTSDPLLVIGMCLSLFAIINDVSNSLFDFTYTVPFIFLANVPEIMRITFSSQMETIKENHSLREDLIKVNRLTEAGSSYLYLAHEILNPLMAAKGYFQLLLKRSDINSSDPKISKYIDVISQQHTRIEHLANSVKKHVKPSEPILQTMDVHHIIKDAIETVQLKADKLNIPIRYEKRESGLKVFCLKDQLIQVLINLMNNSIDAINELSEKWISVETQVSGKHILISVRDSGNGIPEDIREKIWEYRFTTKKDYGTGIGLTICHRIIENHGGQISLNTTSPNTEFLIKLPLQAE